MRSPKPITEKTKNSASSRPQRTSTRPKVSDEPTNLLKEPSSMQSPDPETEFTAGGSKLNH